MNSPNPAHKWNINSFTIASVASLTVIIVAIILTVAGLYFNSQADLRIENQVRDTYLAEAQAIANELEASLLQAIQITKTTTQVISSLKDEQLIEQTLLSITQTIPADFYYGIGVWYAPFALNPTDYFHAPYAYFPSLNEPPLMTREFEGEHYNYFAFDWWIASLEADGNIFYPPLFFDPTDGLVYMSYVQSMFDDAGRFMGVVGVDMVPERFGEVVLARNQQPDTKIYLITERNQLFAHPNVDELLAHQIAQDKNPQSIFDITPQQADDFFRQQIGRDILAVEANVPTSNWTVRIVVDESVANAPITAQNTNTYRFLGFIWILTVVILFILYRINRQIRIAQSNQRLLETRLTEQRIIEKTLQETNIVLEQRVKERTTALEAAKQEAESANHVKSAFLASMSHELRTPLNAIINFTKFVAKGDMGDVNEQQEETLNEVISSGKHLLNLINDVLDMSKIESGSLMLFLEDNISLKDILASCANTAKSLLADKNVSIQTAIADDLPLIRADRQRVMQIMLNLVSNACKFTDEGIIKLSATHYNQDVLISVQDTGHGIALDEQHLVFEAFKQTESGLRQNGGTGLGMPITKSLVQAHGGSIWIESTPNIGTTFFVRLPLVATPTPKPIGELI
jgi:signal transduction histidine kinase